MISEVSLLPGEVGHIGAGTYTDIVAIDAPGSAVAGSRVDVTIRIKNKYSASVHVAAIGTYDTEERFIDWQYYWIPAGVTHSFPGSFVMPARDVTIHAYSYYEAAEGWYFDDEAVKDIKLGEVVGWQLLDSRTIAVKSSLPPVVGWQLLDSRTIAVKSGLPPVVGWQLLDSTTIAVKSGLPPVVGWQLLDEKMVSLTAAPPEEIPPEYELLEEAIYPYAYVYDGDAEVSTFTFKSDPFTPANWISGRLADAVKDQVEQGGGRVMEMRVYVDKTPLLWADWRIEVVGIPPKTEGVAIGIAWWAVAILAALAIALIIVITWSIKTIVSSFTHKPLSPEIKATWTRETLISTIGDFEVKLERTPTPPEELEEKSDEELRDYCDQLAVEIVPPEVSWLPLAILGGVGLLGVGGAAVAYAMAKPREGT